jgi:hypothetical protein
MQSERWIESMVCGIVRVGEKKGGRKSNSGQPVTAGTYYMRV